MVENNNAQVATSWTRIDGIVDPVLQSIRKSICGLVMKHPGIEEVCCGHVSVEDCTDDCVLVQADICERIGNVFPCEVKDLLLAMVSEGVLRSRRVALCAQPRLFRSDALLPQQLHCYWTTPVAVLRQYDD